MAQTAAEAEVCIVAGDTKVIEGNGGLYINTGGVGFLSGNSWSSANCKEGDVILVSGNLGDHHAAILSARMGIENHIQSDCAPLNGLTSALKDAGIRVRAARDATRGGLATILNEFAKASDCCIELEENLLPVSQEVQGFCGILGLDPLTMGNEGKMALAVAPEDAERALSLLRSCRYGKNAAIIGRITLRKKGAVLLKTSIGGTRLLSGLIGEGLPRIC